MKTFFVDLDTLSSETFREVIGFILTVGLNFRKIDLIKLDKAYRVLVIECASKAEERGLKSFLEKHKVSEPIVIDGTNKANLGFKRLGALKQVGTRQVSDYYLDKTTGKKFIIER
jgi:hypothetical protein